jgi:hypothetical protein
MPSILRGYKDDIFISCRKKGNNGERKVSLLADALKIELSTTFKEEISVHFDINPYDGLSLRHDPRFY